MYKKKYKYKKVIIFCKIANSSSGHHAFLISDEDEDVAFAAAQHKKDKMQWGLAC